MADIPSTSKTLFKQTTPPTGWTKLTTHNDYMLRVVSGTASSGGTKSFSSTFAPTIPTGTVSVSSTVNGVSLTTPQIPTHSHTYTIPRTPTAPPAPTYLGSTGTNPGVLVPEQTDYPASLFLQYPTPSPTFPGLWPMATEVTTNQLTLNVGSGTPHSHPLTVSVTTAPGFTGTALSFDVKYVDIILAQRN